MRVKSDMQELEEQQMQLILSRLVLCGECTRTGSVWREISSCLYGIRICYMIC